MRCLCLVNALNTEPNWSWAWSWIYARTKLILGHYMWKNLLNLLIWSVFGNSHMLNKFIILSSDHILSLIAWSKDWQNKWSAGLTFPGMRWMSILYPSMIPSTSESLYSLNSDLAGAAKESDQCDPPLGVGIGNNGATIPVPKQSQAAYAHRQNNDFVHY